MKVNEANSDIFESHQKIIAFVGRSNVHQKQHFPSFFIPLKESNILGQWKMKALEIRVVLFTPKPNSRSLSNLNVYARVSMLLPMNINENDLGCTYSRTVTMYFVAYKECPFRCGLLKAFNKKANHGTSRSHLLSIRHMVAFVTALLLWKQCLWYHRSTRTFKFDVTGKKQRICHRV